MLGQGVSAKVYEAERVSESGRIEKFAVKVMTQDNPAEMQVKAQFMMNEVRALINCPPHDNVIRLHGFCRSGTFY